MAQQTNTAKRPASRAPQPIERRSSVASVARVVVGLLIILALIYVAVFSYHVAQIQLGPFAPLAAILTGALVLAVFGPLLLIRYRTQLRAALAQALHFLGMLASATGLPQRFARRFPRTSRFLAARFTLESPAGLALTLWAVVALALVEQVVELTLEVTVGSAVPALDRRIENLVAIMRTSALDDFFYAVQILGAVHVIGVLTVASLLIALLARRRREALLLLLAATASWLTVQALEQIIARPRPPLSDARVLATGYSFPSAHATLAAAVYGAVAYIAIRALRSDIAKIAVGIVAAVVVLLVGVSDAYLGVQFSSDVLAGWVLGALWLVLLAIADHIWLATHPPQEQPELQMVSSAGRVAHSVVGPLRTASAGGLLLLSLAYAALQVGGSAGSLPQPPQSPPPTVETIAPDALTQTVLSQQPHYTEGLTGDRQEPISIIFVGTQLQVTSAFNDAGWTEAQRFSFSAVTSGVKAVLTHHSDPAGPVTPSFLAEQPNALAFSLPVGTTFAERHHIRIWTTDVQTSDGESLWLATASFDKGFELAPSTGLPTHQIDPHIDAERAFVVASLQGGGDVQSTLSIQLVPPESGHNFDGDPFFTSGQAVIVYLRS